jgi:copper chaperone
MHQLLLKTLLKWSDAKSPNSQKKWVMSSNGNYITDVNKGASMSVHQIQIQVENIKCGGCEKSIIRGLSSIEGLSNIVIDRDQQMVSVNADESLREVLISKLKSMGYPEHGSVTGLDAGLANAKSFVSCAIGRVS